MYQNDEVKDADLAKLDLDELLEGLTAAKENLRAFVEPEAEAPEGTQLADGFYHVAAAAALLGNPDVSATVRQVIRQQRIALPAAEVPVEQMELVGEPL